MNFDHTVTSPINPRKTEEFTILELTENVLRLERSKSEVNFLPLPFNDLKQHKADISHARKKLG